MAGYLADLSEAIVKGDVLISEEVRYYPRNIRRKRSSFRMFLEDSLNLVENPPQNTKEMLFGITPHGVSMFDTTMAIYDSLEDIAEYGPQEIRFSKKIRVYEKTFLVKPFRCLKNERRIAEFLRGYLQKDVRWEDVEGDKKIGVELIIIPIGGLDTKKPDGFMVVKFFLEESVV